MNKKELFFRIITTIAFILFLLIFPLLTIGGWTAFITPIFIIGAVIITLPIIIKFLFGNLKSSHLLLIGIIYSLYWLCGSNIGDGDPFSGLQVFMEHVFGMRMDLSLSMVKILSNISIGLFFIYFIVLFFLMFISRKNNNTNNINPKENNFFNKIKISENKYINLNIDFISKTGLGKWSIKISIILFILALILFCLEKTIHGVWAFYLIWFTSLVDFLYYLFMPLSFLLVILNIIKHKEWRPLFALMALYILIFLIAIFSGSVVW